MLLDKRLKGKVAIPKFGWMGEMWMHAANLSLGGTYDNFDPVIELCRKVIRENDGLVMESNDQGMKMLSTGEVAATPFWVGRTYALQDQGIAGIDFVYPKSWIAYGSGFMIVREHPICRGPAKVSGSRCRRLLKPQSPSSFPTHQPTRTPFPWSRICLGCK